MEAPIENGTGEERPPPGVGENTVTCCRARSRDVSRRDRCPQLRAAEATLWRGRRHSIRTTDDETNPLPLTVQRDAPAPTIIDDGVVDVRTGAGFGPGTTVTAGLVAARVKPPLRNSRNSHAPGVAGIATVQVRFGPPTEDVLDVARVGSTGRC